jgi:hypothetical protein
MPILSRTELSHLRDENNGELPAWAWPGGYPIFYVVEDGGCLCPKCSNLSDVDYTDPYDKQWHIVGSDINYEYASLYCDHCGERIESAYAEESTSEGEPDEDSITTSDHRRFYQYGKLVLEIGEDADYKAELTAYMEREQFWPSCWFVSDHGNTHLIEF